MRRLYSSLLGLSLLAASGLSQAQTDTEFAETAPPKVPVGLLDTAAVSPAPDEAGASEEKSAIDQKIVAVGESMGNAPAGETAALENGQNAPPSDFSPGNALLNGLMALCMVLALFFALVYLGKRFGRRSPLLAGQQLGQVMGRLSLTPQASLHFVRTNGEVLVVGVTQQSVNLLRTFDAAEFGAAESRPEETPAATAAPESSFLDQLREVQNTMPAMPKGVDEDLDLLKGDLQRLQQYIQDSARARE